jgi:hypothetical protein
MTVPIAVLKERRRRRARQLLLLQTSGFGAPGDGELHGAAAGSAVLRASSLLDEDELRASWRLGRDRLLAMAEFEHRQGSEPGALHRTRRP